MPSAEALEIARALDEINKRDGYPVTLTDVEVLRMMFQKAELFNLSNPLLESDDDGVATSPTVLFPNLRRFLLQCFNPQLERRSRQTLLHQVWRTYNPDELAVLINELSRFLGAMKGKTDVQIAAEWTRIFGFRAESADIDPLRTLLADLKCHYKKHLEKMHPLGRPSTPRESPSK